MYTWYSEMGFQLSFSLKTFAIAQISVIFYLSVYMVSKHMGSHLIHQYSQYNLSVYDFGSNASFYKEQRAIFYNESNKIVATSAGISLEEGDSADHNLSSKFNWNIA